VDDGTNRMEGRQIRNGTEGEMGTWEGEVRTWKGREIERKGGKRRKGMERVLLFPHFVPWQRNIPSEFIIFYYQRDDAMFIHYPPRFIATRNRMLSRFKVARNISNCMCYVHVWKKY